MWIDQRGIFNETKKKFTGSIGIIGILDELCYWSMNHFMNCHFLWTIKIQYTSMCVKT